MARLRTPKERQAAPLPGFKLAHPMISADGKRGGFSGVSLGRARVYGVVADAECAQGASHDSPSRWCDCGFYCLHSVDDALALTCDPDYRHAVLLEVFASGRFIRYERGLRYARQRVVKVRVGRCGCGHAATLFADTGGGSVGWRRLVPTCPGCAGGRPLLSFDTFARLLDGTPVVADHTGIVENPDLDDLDESTLVPLLTAEVTLLQARLDAVQRELARLTQPRQG
ncbi:MAG TPA: hypothetical protein VJ870_11575 [Amycolatopsis sp.]|nr:hypothetical protein [Amycolatopsis sp.]